MDWAAVLYDPIYVGLGVPAVFVSAETGADEIEITVIDDTKPKTASGAEHLEVRSVGPGCFVRIPELESNGISRDEYLNAVISFNGRTWTVRSYELRGSPVGEDEGEVRFSLKSIGGTDG